MSGYPLQSVLDLRRREEEAAVTGLADATRARVAAEEHEVALAGKVDLARERARQASQDGDYPHSSHGRDERNAAGIAGCGIGGAAAAARARFAERRRNELEKASTVLEAFRRGPLVEARARESVARENHLAARRTREAFEKHALKHQAAARASAQRRDEEALEEITRATRHAQHRKTDR